VWLENDAIRQQREHNERNVFDDRKQKQHTQNTPQPRGLMFSVNLKT